MNEEELKEYAKQFQKRITPEHLRFIRKCRCEECQEEANRREQLMAYQERQEENGMD